MRIVMMLEICAIKDWLAVCLKEWEVVDNRVNTRQIFGSKRENGSSEAWSAL